MAGFKEFTSTAARPLPVLLLADISGSMAADGKIDTLNRCIAEVIDVFGREDDHRAELQVGVITFGRAGACLHTELTPAAKVNWQPMKADGGTPLGAAISLATKIMEDRAVVPSRAYRPVLVLVSDGRPTDDWQAPLQALLASERGSKADRFALGIGTLAEDELKVLQGFLADSAAPVLRAVDATRIPQFFNFVAMSVTSRSRSVSPNGKPQIDLDEYQELF